MQLFFHPDISENDKQILFPKDESRHIVKVLRKKEGDLLKVTNGKGFLFETEIVDADPQKCVANILSKTFQKKSEAYLHLAVAPTKMNDRYEWFLEKATEIGIDEITPVFCEHSERKVVKLNRFERVIQSAMKQSLHFRIPEINEPLNFAEFIENTTSGDKFIAHCEDDLPRKSLKNEIVPGNKATILIGPEGDFSSEEIKLALEKGWIAVSLGNSRLRTETAGIVACHTFALVNEDKC
ncbi:MAG: 16S rRNA (uracil(1498)-N(3))-methyltransferase [Gillisia sp.]